MMKAGRTGAWLSVAAVVCAVAVLSGCGRKKPVAGEETAAKELPEILAEAAQGAAEGQYDAAVARVKTLYESPSYAAQRPEILTAWLRILLSSNQVEQAQLRFMEAAASGGEELVRPSFTLIGEFLRGRFDFRALQEWTGKVVAMAWKGELAVTATSWHVDALRRMGEAAEMKTTMANAAKRLTPAGCSSVVDYVMERIQEDRRGGEGLEFVDAVRGLPGLAPQLKETLGVWRMRMLLAETKWVDIVQAFEQESANLGGSTLASIVGVVSDNALRANQVDVVDRICLYVLDKRADVEPAVREAARWWTEVPARKHDIGEIVGRLERLRARKVSVKALEGPCLRHFYDVLKSGSEDQKKRIIELANALAGEEKDASERGTIQAMVLDGAVLRDDYVTALSVLDAGFRASETNWHAMARNKILAHAALQAGRKEEAIERFRAFMQNSEAWGESTADPMSGINYTREMTLGRNAKRIGDLYESMERHEEARAAWEESRGYYTKAQKAVRPESEESKLVEAELKALPPPK